MAIFWDDVDDESICVEGGTATTFLAKADVYRTMEEHQLDSFDAAVEFMAGHLDNI